MSKSKTPKTGDADSATKSLHAKCEAIRELDKKWARQEIAVRYQLATHCKDIVEGDGIDKRYGNHAVERAAQEIGWAAAQIYSHAQVAQTWTEAEVLELHESKGCAWRHLEILARDKVAPEERDRLIEKVAEDGLSVRALQQEVAAISAPQAQVANYTVDVSPSVAVVTGIQDYSANITHFETDSRNFVDRLRACVAAATAEELTPAALQQLRQVRQRRKAACEHDIKALDDCIAKAQKANRAKKAAGKQQDTKSSVTAKPSPAAPKAKRPAGAGENSARTEDLTT
jgi:DNA-binding protein H-NS